VKVCLLLQIQSLSLVLVKAVSKDLVTRVKKISQVFREKDILARLTDCTYAVKLYCTFQDEKTLCKYSLVNKNNRTEIKKLQDCSETVS
jgi:serine/threonine protein kinase